MLYVNYILLFIFIFHTPCSNLATQSDAKQNGRPAVTLGWFGVIDSRYVSLYAYRSLEACLGI